MMSTIKFVLLTVACCSLAMNQRASATTLPITFEQPTYVTGPVVPQDGWAQIFVFGTAGVTISDQNPISGAQSLRTQGGAAGTESAASGNLNITPANLSFLARVDSNGTAAFETGLATGLATDLPNGVGPITMIFAANGELQYYDSGDIPFPGNPTYSVGVVYRVELTNISEPNDTYDAAIYDNNTNGLIASAVGLDLQSELADAKFYTLHRGGPNGVAYVDNVTVVPEPASMTLVGLGGLALTLAYRRSRQ